MFWSAVFNKADLWQITRPLLPIRGSAPCGIIEYVFMTPHSTGRKFYVMCDSMTFFSLRVYSYTGTHGILRRRRVHLAGSFFAAKIVHHFAAPVNPDVLIVDNRFLRITQVGGGTSKQAERLLVPCEERTTGATRGGWGLEERGVVCDHERRRGRRPPCI